MNISVLADAVYWPGNMRVDKRRSSWITSVQLSLKKQRLANPAEPFQSERLKTLQRKQKSPHSALMFKFHPGPN